MRRSALAVFLLAACRASEAPGRGHSVGGPELVAPVSSAPVHAEAAWVSFPDGSRLRVAVADTPEARERGLMFRKTLAPDEGMLFLFGSDQTLGFWMKNTFVDLDMLWLDGSGRVTTLHERVPKSMAGMTDEQVATRAGFGSYVLELAAGQAGRRGVVRGSSLKLELEAR